MNLPTLSLRRPVFITCLVILLLTLGYISLQKLPVNLFPDVTFPVVLINTTYEGAGPEEVETSVSKIIEDEINNISGIKTLSSSNTEGRSQVVVEFTSDTDIKSAQQEVRDRISSVRAKLPKEVKDPSIKYIDPADKPVAILALTSELPKTQLADLAKNTIKIKLEQINQVGMVEALGNNDREIHVDLDRHKLYQHDISASYVAKRIGEAGQDVPVGKIDQGMKEKIFSAQGEYKTLEDIGAVIVNFLGNERPITVADLGNISDSAVDITSKTYVNGQPALILMLYRQSGANTVEVLEKVKKKIDDINSALKNNHLPANLSIVRDGAKMIRANVDNVMESIFVGITLTVIVVYLFLGSIRSTLITSLALPTSLLGSFWLMHLAGFSINTMSLLALSLAVGLLVDDAIVVRENIYRHIQMGQDAHHAALDGTQEVLLAVIATSLTVVAVFGPIGFLHGVVGSFFREFGLTVCFAMIISLFDAITIAPMLSAYIGLGRPEKHNKLIAIFQKFQTFLEYCYEKTLKVIVMRHPLLILLSAALIFAASIYAVRYVPKTFLPPQDSGEFVLSLELPPGANLKAMDEMAHRVGETIRTYPEIATLVSIVGAHNEPNKAQFFINMVPSQERSLSTMQLRQKLRQELKQFKGVKIVTKDVDLVGGGERAFNLMLTGDDLEALKTTSFKIYDILKQNKGLVDPEISYQSGKPEMKIIPERTKLKQFGVSSATLGEELRTAIEGTVPAVLRQHGQEYDIRVRLQENQRDLEKSFNATLIPNMNNVLVRLSDVAKARQSLAPVSITRKDRARYIQIAADIAPNGPGIGGIINETKQLLETKLTLPPGITYSFQGQAESYNELTHNMAIAIGLGILFIYLVLASLYESFLTPFTIMLVLPLAACGAFFALLITHHALDVFSMIGCVLLFGIATKNSILLVDYTRQLTLQGISLEQAIVQAGLTRLRPILMTTIALIAGMLPIAIGLNEVSKQRTSMGIAVIGGLISSTLLTLVVVPAAYAYLQRLKLWVKSISLSKKYPTLIPNQPQNEA
jgi:hydrophobic/amphiphilic exporter-1 (mainly G- bacteria), HAE1 family